MFLQMHRVSYPSDCPITSFILKPARMVIWTMVRRAHGHTHTYGYERVDGAPERESPSHLCMRPALRHHPHAPSFKNSVNCFVLQYMAALSFSGSKALTFMDTAFLALKSSRLTSRLQAARASIQGWKLDVGLRHREKGSAFSRKSRAVAQQSTVLQESDGGRASRLFLSYGEELLLSPKRRFLPERHAR